MKCRYCHRTESLTKDHILPVSRGGKNNKSNIQILCNVCNGTKGNYTDLEIAVILRDIKKQGVLHRWERPFVKLLQYIETNRREPLNW